MVSVAAEPAAPLDLYAEGLAGRTAVRVAYADGTSAPLPLARWTGAPADAAERALLDRVRGPALEVGCGPARHVRALLDRGVLAVGVDVSAAAVALAHAAGALALRGCVFDAMPGAGDWRDVLLLDGSLGIGGDPVALLVRVAELLAPDGTAWLELDPAGTLTATELVRLEAGGRSSAPFRWSRVPPDALAPARRRGAACARPRR